MARGGGKKRRWKFSWGNTKITRGALYLMFAEVGLSLVYLMLDDAARLDMLLFLAASTEQVWGDFKVWTLVSSPLLQNNFLPLVFHALILWMFVPTLERWWGTKKFLLFALYTSLAGTLAGTLAGLGFHDGGVVLGLDPFIYASIVAYGVLYRDQPVQFFGVLPMTGRQLMIGIIAFCALFVVLGRQWSLGAAYGAAMLVAWLLTSGKWNPKLWWLQHKQKKVRRHLKLVRDEDEKGKKWLN